MFDKLIAFAVSFVTFFLSIFGSGFLPVGSVIDNNNPIYSFQENFKLMSFNIKSGGKKKESPENRVDSVKMVIEANSPDVLAIQEATDFWMEQLPQLVGDKYGIVGVGRCEPGDGNEATPILYLKDKYSLVDQGTFWLSDTPDVMSNTWNDSHNRICTYAILQNKESGFTFAQFNTHYDAESDNYSRDKSSDLIVQKIAEIAGDLPVVLCGDFNTKAGSVAYNKLIESGLTDSKTVALNVNPGKTGRSYHGYDLINRIIDGEPIDFIFVNDKFKSVNSYLIDDQKYDGVYPSDHYPLIGEITLSDKNVDNAKVIQNVTAMTYNVYISGSGEKSPENRAEYVIENIRKYMPDSFGLEEADINWIERISLGMPEYAYVGNGRDKDLGGEYSPVFYLKDKYEVVKSGTFWLSATPEKASRGWDAMMNRICTYAVLKDKQTGFVYAHFNAHFDHLGVTARQNSVAVVIDKINEICPNTPVIFSGDLNDSENSEMYNRILKSGLKDSKHLAKTTMSSPTYHGYSKITENTRPEPIDFIFVNSYALDVQLYNVDKTTYNGIYASDHHPVVSKITFVN